MAEFRSAMKWEYCGSLYQLADDRLDESGYLVFRPADRPDGPKVHFSPQTFARNFRLVECPVDQRVVFKREGGQK